MVKNPLPMQETYKTWIRSLGREDSLEEGKAQGYGLGERRTGFKSWLFISQLCDLGQVTLSRDKVLMSLVLLILKMGTRTFCVGGCHQDIYSLCSHLVGSVRFAASLSLFFPHCICGWKVCR